MHAPLELTLLILAASVIAVTGARMLQLPPMLAYLAVGIVLGPLLVWISGGAEVVSGPAAALGEIGVVFLMFSIGLEFNLGKLHALRHHVFRLGGLQVGLTLLAAFSLPWLLPLPAQRWLLGSELDWRAMLVLGGALAMSSTALVVKMLDERRELESEHGRRVFGVLLFQDLAVVPLLVLIPALSRDSDGWALPMAWAGLKAVLLLALLLRFGQPAMRGWFHLVARRKSHELFTLNVLLVVLLAAWVTHSAGLSLELGAFVAGMLIAETEYRWQVEEDIKPFRDVLLGLFFITLGMRLDPAVVLAQWPLVIVLTLVPMAGKFALVAALARLLGAPPAVALRTGLWLAQAGEFGFVVLTAAVGSALVAAPQLQPVLAAMLLSMVLSPLLLARSDALLLRLSGQEWMQRSLALSRIAAKSIARERHVIVCGYGRSGQAVAHVLEAEKIPFVALDLDPDRVREASAAGETVVYGDCVRREALLAAGVHRASALVVSFADTDTTVRLLAQVQALAPMLPVLVRTADGRDIVRLREAGATEVVPEIVEGSLMLASHALALAGVPLSRVLRRVRTVRDDHYGLLRGFFHGADDDAGEDAIEGDEIRLRTVSIDPAAGSIGCTLALLGVGDDDRPRDAVRVAALVRRQVRVLDPPPDLVLQVGDTLVLAGSLESLADAEQRLARGV